MLGGMNPAMLGGMNPAMLGGMNPAMLGGINPAMLGGMNPAMLGMNGIQPGNGATNGAQFGYGPTTSLAPTIFTTPLSGDGTLQAHDSRRASQELYAEQNSTAASYDVAIKAGETAQLVTSGAGIGLSALVGGGLGKLAKSSKLGWAVFLAGSIASGIGGNLVRRATAGTVQKATRDGLHKQAIQSYTGLDTADNGWRDGSYTAQRNYRTQDTPEGLKQDMLTAGLGYFGLAPQSKGLRLTPGT